ncbi:MAG: folate-binding protein YgfZ [Rhodospirillaceae bacterium]|nr:folate-binding protein YgfZ [Rhodospirillaceae bacterium]MBT3808028.1 folate-binding protein YgfZ [Rhodospirillaceae bacterium]MBT3931544.1 folate-binding protein YgfZ [Rhodospirillaceae bacterium]MBT4773687.1 folate-binding protein YgfZ [Rhodospirillaceae bacterium]MBT5358916.1 folate-binding protein YgfZ [Rhodospirillaceae bacterium]
MTICSVTLQRDIVAISGADNRTFLQGLVSQDMDRISTGMSVYSALLTPQGKYLHDFLIAQSGDSLLVDCEAGRGADLIQRLSRFKLRADVQLETREDLRVVAILGAGAPETMGLSMEPGQTVPIADGLAFVDPRASALGCRFIGSPTATRAWLEQAGVPEADFETYDALRISLEIPDGSRDMDVEKSTLMESNFDDLNGIDWEKGCYMGQELTARTKYRGLVKRKLAAFQATHASQIPGETVLMGDQKVGEIRSRSGDRVLISIRLDALDSAPLALSVAGEPLIEPPTPAR